MNKLYGILVAPLHGAEAGSYYMKRHAAMGDRPELATLRDLVIGHVPPQRLPMFTCFLCHEVLDTDFGQDILKEDPCNTYFKVPRKPGAEALDSALWIWDLTRNSRRLSGVPGMLDLDIAERLSAPGWLDLSAAACLQLLRRA